MSVILIAIILGLVQGLCEFLPVSSSGHLQLMYAVFGESAFGISDYTGFFTIMLHLGTLAAVFVVYRRTIVDIIKHPIQKKTGMLLLSTIVTVVIYVLGKKVFDSAIDTNGLLGFCFLFTALILVISDRITIPHGKKSKEKGNDDGSIEQMRLPSALGIGFMQGIGIFPGVSRSGSTIAGAKLLGLNRKAAAEYSFLLSIPAILGGLVTEIPDVAEKGLSNVPWLPIIVGTVVAGVAGYFAIKFMIRLITNRKLWGFSIYVGILGAFVLLDQYVFHIVF